MLGFLTGVALQILVTYINTKFLGASGAQFVLGQHAQDGIANHFSGLLLHTPANRNFLKAAGIATVTVVHLLIDLVSSESDFLGIDDHDVVAALLIRSEIGLILADEHAGHASGQAPEDLIVRVNDEPILAFRNLLSFFTARNERPHISSDTFPVKTNVENKLGGEVCQLGRRHEGCSLRRLAREREPQRNVANQTLGSI
jgi:hypothetical protein